MRLGKFFVIEDDRITRGCLPIVNVDDCGAYSLLRIEASNAGRGGSLTVGVELDDHVVKRLIELLSKVQADRAAAAAAVPPPPPPAPENIRVTEGQPLGPRGEPPDRRQ